MIRTLHNKYNKYDFLSLRDFLCSYKGWFAGVIFLLLFSGEVYDKRTFFAAFEPLYSSLSLLIPLFLLSIWGRNDKNHYNILQAIVSADLFLIMLFLFSTPSLIIDSVLYNGEWLLAFWSYISIILTSLVFISISAFCFVLFSNSILGAFVALTLCLIGANLFSSQFVLMILGIADLWTVVFLVLCIVFFTFGAKLLSEYRKKPRDIYELWLRFICLIVIVVSTNLIFLPLKSECFFDFSLSKQFSLSANEIRAINEITSPITIVLSVPNSILKQNPKSKPLIQILSSYLHSMQKAHKGELLTIKNEIGTFSQGQFAIVIVDDKGRETFVSLPWKKEEKAFKKELFSEILKTGKSGTSALNNYVNAEYENELDGENDSDSKAWLWLWTLLPSSTLAFLIFWLSVLLWLNHRTINSPLNTKHNLTKGRKNAPDK